MKASTRTIIRNALDMQIPAMHDARKLIRQPIKGWLRAVRDAVGLQQSEVARKLGVTRQSYAQLERAEVRRSITLGSLDRAADAMDCEVVCFLVPKESAGRTFAELAQVHDPMFQHLKKSEHSMALEGQAVGDLKKNQP
jgi:predicted DNA-binding mobile mystery protein A